MKSDDIQALNIIYKPISLSLIMLKKYDKLNNHLD